MYTVGEFKELVLNKMREFTNGGELVGDTDYTISMIYLLNDIQLTIATEIKNIKKIFKISQNNPTNQLGGSWNQDAVHDDEDVSYSATGSNAYSFEITNHATVYIEEEIAGTWTELIKFVKTLDQLTKTVNAVDTVIELDGETEYINVKGKTGISDTSNDIRIRFSGDFNYAYRYIGLFSENYFNDDACPKYNPFVSYVLPDNFYQNIRVEREHRSEVVEGYNTFLWSIEDKVKSISFNWDEVGQYNIHYYAYPAKVSIPPSNDLTLYDDVELDIPDEAIPAMADSVGAVLLRDENAYISDTLLNNSFIAMNNLEANADNEQGHRTVINNKGW